MDELDETPFKRLEREGNTSCASIRSGKMNRRSFVTALTGLIAAPALFEQIKTHRWRGVNIPRITGANKPRYLSDGTRIYDINPHFMLIYNLEYTYMTIYSLDNGPRKEFISHFYISNEDYERLGNKGLRDAMFGIKS
jgi:hypothetical protein